MALILSIETGTAVCSAALAKDGQVIGIKESLQGREHGAKLALFVDELLREASIEAQELDAVAVGRGPGSYTGLRIGVSLAKGICYGTGAKLISIDSLEALSSIALKVVADPEALYIPMIDARRMEIYARVFDAQLHPLTDVEAIVVDGDTFSQYSHRRVVSFGDGAGKCQELLPWVEMVEITPSAQGMVALAQKAFDEGKVEDTAYFEPLYLKDFVVIASKKKLF